jgi:hypothetical protein
MMQLVLIVHTKRKETICYCESFGYGGKYALDKRVYFPLVYLQKMDQTSASWAFH